jgi:hypothetical protein
MVSPPSNAPTTNAAMSGINEPGTSHGNSLRSTLLYNISSCHISAVDFLIPPELHKTTRTVLQAPSLYIPDKVPVVAESEDQQLEEMDPTKIRDLEDMSSRVMTLHRTLDFDSVIRLYHDKQLQNNSLHWHSVDPTLIAFTALFGILYLFPRPRLSGLRYSASKTSGSIQTPSPDPESQQHESAVQGEAQEQTVVYVVFFISTKVGRVAQLRETRCRNGRRHISRFCSVRNSSVPRLFTHRSMKDALH